MDEDGTGAKMSAPAAAAYAMQCGGPAVVRHVGDLRDWEAASRTAVVFRAAGVSNEEIEHVAVGARAFGEGPVRHLIFGREEECQAFLEKVPVLIVRNQCPADRQLRAEVALGSKDLYEPYLDTRLRRLFKHLKFEWKPHLLVATVQAVDGVQVDERLQFDAWLRRTKHFHPSIVKAYGSWRDLAALRSRAEASGETRIHVEPGRFLVYGSKWERDRVAGELKAAVEHLACRAERVVPFGEGLAALEGPGGSTLERLRADFPTVDFRLDLNRRRVHSVGPEPALSEAVDSVHRALAQVDLDPGAPCAYCCKPAHGATQLQFCGCRCCRPCFEKHYLDACRRCGGPVLVSDVVERLGDRCDDAIRHLYTQYLGANCAPGEQISLCTGCLTPFLAAGSASHGGRSCPGCQLAAERAGYVDLRVDADASGPRELEELEKICHVSDRGSGWKRLSGHANDLAAAIQRCSQWARRVKEELPIPKHTDEFVADEVRRRRLGQKYRVHLRATPRRVQLDGCAVRVDEAKQALQELFLGLQCLPVPIKSDQQDLIKLFETSDVHIKVTSGIVNVVGFPPRVQEVAEQVEDVLKGHTALIDLPRFESCPELPWKCIEPSFTIFDQRVRFMSESGRRALRLWGPVDAVEKARDDVSSLLGRLEFRTIEVAKEKVCHVIGKKGASIKRLQDMGATVLFKQFDCCIHVGGAADHLQAVTAAINRLLNRV
ncbi:unnamed protein product [Prorocentrum cordatum]|uniref:K Homology domain-containing protein n=1 Tax=Prorocentrum cordatum TaxID=2364126 RepID=A0ABN9T7I0_9DINO|nr:unnamed protein product [Polarella glacialis]